MNHELPLFGKVALITGATRGIGHATALKLSSLGAKIGVLGKTETPHPQLPGTVDSVVQEIRNQGGQALGLVTDIRDENAVQAAVQQLVETFGQLDILINNASAISLTNTLKTPAKRWDLMMNVNARGTFVCSQAAIPHLLKASNPHIVTLSPPLDIQAKWFKPHLPYTLSKFGMSLCVLGLSAEFKSQGIAVNALWPKTTIQTAAIEFASREFGLPEDAYRHSRKPSIVSDAIAWIVQQNSRTYTGQFLLDENVLKEAGITDFRSYMTEPDAKPYPDLFV